MKLLIINTEEKFEVHVICENGITTHICGWRGNPYFEVKPNEFYAVLGPYHGLENFKLFKLVEVAKDTD